MLTLVVASCRREVVPSVVEPTTTHKLIIEKDDFQQGNYNLKKRPVTEELLRASRGGPKGKPPVDTTKTNPPPPTDTTTTTPPPPTTSIPKGYAVVKLDFDGEYVANTYWSTIPLTLNYSGLSQVAIDTIYNRFVRAYARYKIYFTTSEADYQAANPLERMRIVFTESWEWYGKYGGVSYIGSLTWGDNTPCFVFSSLLNYDAKRCSDAGIHEIGHTIALYHQSQYDSAGTKLQEYNPGDGVNAPWMGIAYYVPFGSWWKGTNSYGGYQDDDATITRIVGLK